MRLQTQLQYQTSRDMLGNGVLAAEDVRLHLIYNLFQHSIYQRRVFLSTLFLLLQLHTLHPEGHTMVEKPQGPPNLGGHGPGLRAKQKYLLHGCFIECVRGLGVRNILAQNTGHPGPLLLGLPLF